MSPVFGLRYSSPLVTGGGMLSPTDGRLHCLWLVSCPTSWNKRRVAYVYACVVPSIYSDSFMLQHIIHSAA